MSDLRCPRCGDSFRIPSVDLPSGPPAADLSARCPWCGELIPLQQLLTALPPVAQLIGHDGQPLAVAASSGEGANPFALQPAGLPPAVDEAALSGDASGSEDDFLAATGFAGESFDVAAMEAGERSAASELYGGDDQDADAGLRDEDFVGDGPEFANAGFEADGFEADEEADTFELAEQTGPVDPRPLEEVSEANFAPEGHLVTPRARGKKKSSSLRSILGVVVGGLLALPLAAGILALVGKPLDLGFWPFDGKTIATGGSARTAAPMRPMSEEARPARSPQQGRSLAEDMPGGELMTMDPADQPELPSDEPSATTEPDSPRELSPTPGQTSTAGPEMVMPQLAEAAEPEAAVAEAAAFDPFAAEPFAADSRSRSVAEPDGPVSEVPAADMPALDVAEPSAAAPGDLATRMNSDPFAPLEQPLDPLDSEPAPADPPASPANEFSLEDPRLTLPTSPAAAAEAGDDAARSQPPAAAPDAAAEPGAGETPATAPEAEPADEPPMTEPPTAEPPANEPPANEPPADEPPAAEAPSPRAPAADVAEAPAAEEPAAAPAEPAPAKAAAAAEAVVAGGAQASQPEGSPQGQPAEAAGPEQPASSPEFAAAQTAAKAALQAIRDYDLTAGIAGLRPHLANLYEQVAALGELAEPRDGPALAALTEQMLEINVVKDLAPAAPNWAKYSRRPNDGMLAVGPLRREADTWLLDWGGPTPLEIRFGQGDAEAQPQAKVLVLGRILSSDPAAPAMEATFLQSLD